VQLSARKPTNPAYPRELKALGNHLRKRRLDLGLLQRDVARILGVSEASVWQWENNQTKPRVSLVPRVYDFLGYAPYAPTDRLGDWLRQARRGLGLSRRKLAAKLRMDVTTIDRWERGRGQPTAASLARIRRVLDRFSRVNRTG